MPNAPTMPTEPREPTPPRPAPARPVPVSLLALLLANAVPLAGTLLLGWDVADVFAVFWLESAIVGAVTVLKLLLAAGPLAARLALVPFFALHFGMFMFVHAVFIQVLVLEGGRGSGIGPGPAAMTAAPRVLLDRALDGTGGAGSGGAMALLALAASHGVSFVQHFLLGGERARLRPELVMVSPYPRVVVMHGVLLVGGFLAFAGGGATWMLALLVVAKTVADATAHLRQHRVDDATTAATRSGAAAG